MASQEVWCSKVRAKELNNACEAKAKQYLDGSLFLVRIVILYAPSNPRSYRLTTELSRGIQARLKAMRIFICPVVHKLTKVLVSRVIRSGVCFGMRLKVGSVFLSLCNWSVDLCLIVCGDEC